MRLGEAVAAPGIAACSAPAATTPTQWLDAAGSNSAEHESFTKAAELAGGSAQPADSLSLEEVEREYLLLQEEQLRHEAARLRPHAVPPVDSRAVLAIPPLASGESAAQHLAARAASPWRASLEFYTPSTQPTQLQPQQAGALSALSDWTDPRATQLKLKLTPASDEEGRLDRERARLIEAEYEQRALLAAQRKASRMIKSHSERSCEMEPMEESRSEASSISSRKASFLETANAVPTTVQEYIGSSSSSYSSPDERMVAVSTIGSGGSRDVRVIPEVNGSAESLRSTQPNGVAAAAVASTELRSQIAPWLTIDEWCRRIRVPHIVPMLEELGIVYPSDLLKLPISAHSKLQLKKLEGRRFHRALHQLTLHKGAALDCASESHLSFADETVVSETDYTFDVDDDRSVRTLDLVNDKPAVQGRVRADPHAVQLDVDVETARTAPVTQPSALRSNGSPSSQKASDEAEHSLEHDRVGHAGMSDSRESNRSAISTDGRHPPNPSTFMVAHCIGRNFEIGTALTTHAASSNCAKVYQYLCHVYQYYEYLCQVPHDHGLSPSSQTPDCVLLRAVLSPTLTTSDQSSHLARPQQRSPMQTDLEVRSSKRSWRTRGLRRLTWMRRWQRPKDALQCFVSNTQTLKL